MPTLTSDKCEPKRELDIHSKMSHLDNIIDEASSALNDLTIRLDNGGVLRFVESVPEPTNEKVSDEALTPISQTLASYASRIKIIKQYAEETLKRLEV